VGVAESGLSLPDILACTVNREQVCGAVAGLSMPGIVAGGIVNIVCSAEDLSSTCTCGCFGNSLCSSQARYQNPPEQPRYFGRSLGSLQTRYQNIQGNL
jgi:hypothetical protein